MNTTRLAVAAASGHLGADVLRACLAHIAAAPRRLFDAIMEARRRKATMELLRRLDDRILRDIGLRRPHREEVTRSLRSTLG